jgi:hypothetical protein
MGYIGWNQARQSDAWQQSLDVSSEPHPGLCYGQAACMFVLKISAAKQVLLEPILCLNATPGTLFLLKAWTTTPYAVPSTHSAQRNITCHRHDSGTAVDRKLAVGPSALLPKPLSSCCQPQTRFEFRSDLSSIAADDLHGHEAEGGTALSCICCIYATFTGGCWR